MKITSTQAARTVYAPFLLLLPLLGLGSGCNSPSGSRTGEQLATARRARAQLGESRVPERGFDVEHYALELTLSPETRSIEGVCKIRLAAVEDGLTTVVLDLQDLIVSSVRTSSGADSAAAQELAFFQGDDKLAIKLGTALNRIDFIELEIHYGGRPRTGLWFSGKDASGVGPTQVFSHGQAQNNSGWFPCLDHPSDRATSEIRVTMPIDWVAVAAGERIDVVESGGQRTEHWSMSTPHPAYLLSLVAGEFAVSEGEWDGVPLSFLVEPQYRDWVEASFHETDEVLGFLSDYTGLRYPYAKYSQACVANFPWGGMENVSATTLTPLTLADERGNRDLQSTPLIAHEAAHQWFGDLLTCNNWSHIWLNEGFATYLELLYAEATEGVDALRIGARDAQDRYLEEDAERGRRATVSERWIEPEDLMDTRVYEGAAARLHLLRFIIGDTAFRAGVRSYVAENKGRGVVTEDLRKAMEQAAGQDLSVFFDQWIYGPGHPEFVLQWDWDEQSEIVRLKVRQTQGRHPETPRAFRVPVNIEIRDEGGTTLQRIEITRREETFELPVAGRPLYVIFDKYGWIPKKVTWRNERASEYLVKAYEDDDAGGRRVAVRALGRLARASRERSELLDNQTIVRELTHRLKREPVSAVREAVAESLGMAGGYEALESLLVAAREDEDASVRVAALEALEDFGSDDRIAEQARAAFDDQFSWDTMGAAAGLVCSADPDGAYSWITKRLFVDSPHDRLRASLFHHLGDLDNREVAGQLRRWASDDSVHPSARAVAVSILGGLPLEQGKNSRFVAPFLEAENFRLRNSAVVALARLRTQAARHALEAYYDVARTSGERRVIEAALSGNNH